MSTFKSSVSIEQPPGAVFDFLSDLRNVPRYLDLVTAAEPLGDERVGITVEVEGRVTVTDGTFRIHGGHRRRIEWAIDAYSGWVEVDPEGEVCSVTAEVHTGADADLDAELDRALLALKSELDAL